MERDIFDYWRQEDGSFYSTKASREVENLINSKNFVTVAGNSGCGKSAIIQHIALKYKKDGWYVRLFESVKDIIDEYTSENIAENRSLFVLNDPIGKEYLDEIAYSSWRKYKSTIILIKRKVKLLISCRKHFLDNQRFLVLLKEMSTIVVVDENANRLSNDEKR